MTRTLLAICALLLLSSPASANVGVFSGDGHTIQLSSTEDVEMVSEDITIIPGRGRFLFDGSVPGMDRVDFDCRFVLKNRKDAKTTIQVGFPLNSQFLGLPYDNKKKTSEVVAEFGFIAQEEDRQHSVRYVAGDGKKQLSSVFLWEMTFGPRETRTLRVTYAIPMSMTLASTARDIQASKYAKPWFADLEMCLLEWLGYVTSTGRSWKGTIKKARFRIYVKGFEDYLRQRPFVERAEPTPEGERESPFPVLRPLPLRIASPGGWKLDEKGFLELSYENYTPREDLKLSYYLLPFPQTVKEARRFLTRVFPKGPSTEDREDLADIFREFNGTKTENKRIAPFLANQIWHGKKVTRKVPEAVLEAIQPK